MDLDATYENVECMGIKSTTEPQTQSHYQDEGKDLKRRGRCLVLVTVGLGFICALLLIFIILQHITITTERDLIKSYKNTAKERNQTINSLQDMYADLITEKHQLQNNFNSLSQEKLELETRVNNLIAEKSQLQKGFEVLNKKDTVCFFLSSELKSWSDSRQYCRDHGADLVIINNEEKQRFISSLVSEKMWIGLSDTEQEGTMKWVDNSPLKQGYWIEGEPNNYEGVDEDCIEMKPSEEILNNWNDVPCSINRKGICEK